MILLYRLGTGPPVADYSLAVGKRTRVVNCTGPVWVSGWSLIVGKMYDINYRLGTSLAVADYSLAVGERAL